MEYTFREMPDMNGTGKRRMYPKVNHCNLMSQKDFYELMEKITHLNRGVTEAVITGLATTIETAFISGDSVKVPGLGVFSLALGMKKGAETQYLQKRGEHYDTQDVEIKTVKFLADRQWVKGMRRGLDLVKADGVKTIRKTKNTEEERYQMALEFLESQPYMTVHHYVQLTKLGRTKAAEELKAFAADPERKIRRTGRGSHVLYVKKDDT
jgi:predicted histone-like DNA-binding protein